MGWSAGASNLNGLESEPLLEQTSCSRTILSSIQGFSLPTSQRILTLEDLLTYIQSLGLTKFSSSQIEKGILLGHGASYKVFASTDRNTGAAIAVKRVKLPSSSTSYEAFEQRVISVLRDIEVMRHAPLLEHKNVLRILGYGWDYEEKDTIPYLVTELATGGNLRQYMRNSMGTITTKLKLCGDIVAGIYEIHLSGICHGDVKLDNVLVNITSQTCSNSRDMLGHDHECPIAKISDFGHSIILASDIVSISQYRGTARYCPPEVLSTDPKLSVIDLRKCDLWALGLASWEVMIDGGHYYETSIVQEALLVERTRAAHMMGSDINHGSIGLSKKSFDMPDPKTLRGLSNVLSTLACRSIEERVNRGQNSEHWNGHGRTFLEMLLNSDPRKRSTDAFALPLFIDRRIPKATTLRQQLVPVNATERVWNFNTFKPNQMALKPASARERILQDFKLMTAHQDPSQASRANLHVAYAYATGFGVEKSLPTFEKLVRECAYQGSEIARPIATLLTGKIGQVDQKDAILQYSFTIRKFLQDSEPKPKRELLPQDPTFEEIRASCLEASHSMGAPELPTSIVAVHYQATSKIPSGASVNDQHPLTGETALVTACRMGDYQAVLNLTDRGANASISDGKGRLPLHWLCVFEDRYVEAVAERLTRDWNLQHINSTTSESTIPDIQFPLLLHGTPLSFAVTTCSTEAVRVLIALGADPTFYNEEGNTECGDFAAINIAISLHLTDIAKLLWNSICEVKSGQSGLSSLTRSLCYMARSSIIERYLIHGNQHMSMAYQLANFLREIAPCNQTSYEPLMTCVQMMDFELIDILLRAYYHSAQEAKDEVFRMCLEVASGGALDWKESTLLLDFSLSQGANINKIFYFGRAIDFMIRHRQEQLISRWLLLKGPLVNQAMSQTTTPTSSPTVPLKSETQADIHSQPQTCFQPLYDIIEHNLSTLVPIERLLSLGANPEEINTSSGSTVLQLAVVRGMKRDVQMLLRYGANPCQFNRQGGTAFHKAAEKGDCEIIRELLPQVANVDILDKERRTALSIATNHNHAEAVECLLEKGCQPYVSGVHQTALHVAAKGGCYESLRAIIKSDLSLNSVDRDGCTPLQAALRNNHHHCAIALLDAGALPNAFTWTVDPPVHLVLRHYTGRSRLDLLSRLLHHGANMDTRTLDGTGPLHLAAFQGDLLVVDFLLRVGIDATALGNRGRTALHECVRIVPRTKGVTPSPVDLQARCRLIRTLNEWGAEAAFKPFAQAGPSSNSNENHLTGSDYDLRRLERSSRPYEETEALVEQDLSSSLNARLSTENDRSVSPEAIKITGEPVFKRWQTSLKQWQKGFQNRQIQAKQEKEFQKANRVHGYGITLFRDRDGKSALDHAVFRANDTEVLSTLLEIHCDVLAQQRLDEMKLCEQEPSAETSIIDSPREHLAVIQESWRAAVESGRWNAVEVLYSCGRSVDLDLLRWPVGGRFLQYALTHNKRNFLKMFMDKDFLGAPCKDLTPCHPHWPRFPFLGKALSTDLHYLRKITSKFFLASHHWTVWSTWDWENVGRHLVNHEARMKVGAAALRSYMATRNWNLSSQGHPLHVIWENMLDMDWQASNLFYSTLKLYKEIGRSSIWGKDPDSIEPSINDSFLQFRLVELIGACATSRQRPAWIQESPLYDCTPSKMSIPLGLIYDVAVEKLVSEPRVKRLGEIVASFKDLLQLMKHEWFCYYFIKFETTADEEWFAKTCHWMQVMLNWLEKVYSFELEKGR